MSKKNNGFVKVELTDKEQKVLRMIQEFLYEMKNTKSENKWKKAVDFAFSCNMGLGRNRYKPNDTYLYFGSYLTEIILPFLLVDSEHTDIDKIVEKLDAECTKKKIALDEQLKEITKQSMEESFKKNKEELDKKAKEQLGDDYETNEIYLNDLECLKKMFKKDK